MKNKVLFVMNNLRVGGAEKCLISLLNELDYDKYEVDLYLFQHEGKLFHKIPKEVCLLPKPENFIFFDSSFYQTIYTNLLKFNWRIIFDRIRFSLNSATDKPAAVKEQINWKYLKNNIQKLNKEYDVAFGFLEKTPNYFVIDKVMAKKKILAIMSDYKALQMDRDIDVPFFEKANLITVLSEESKATLEDVFPEFRNKILLLENMISEKDVLSSAEEKIVDFPENIFTIISVGRLVESKLHETGLEAMKILKERNLIFKWVIIGDGDKKNDLQNKIKEYHLENYISLLGEKDNPYPYIKKADIFLHLSKFEGYGIAIAEARILKKCIMLNDFTTAYSHIKNGFDGVISPLDPEKIADELEKLILDENLRKKYEQNVSFDKDFAEKILKKIEDIVEN